MKNISKLLFLATAMVTMMWSCKKDEKQVFYEGGTSPVLSASKTTTIPLAYADSTKEAVKFTWTNPDYKFSTGISSQDVSYVLQMDTAGANFSRVTRKEVSISKELAVSINNADLNDYLSNQMVLTAGKTHSIEVRIKANLVNNTAVLYSNTLKFSVTPYVIPPKVTPPTTEKLYLVGSATPGGWTNPVPVPTQQFTKISSTLYELTVPLIGGGSYLALPLNGDWGTKFGFKGANNGNNVDGDDFSNGGGDILAPAASGNYKISFDFQRGKFTVTKL